MFAMKKSRTPSKKSAKQSRRKYQKKQGKTKAGPTGPMGLQLVPYTHIPDYLQTFDFDTKDFVFDSSQGSLCFGQAKSANGLVRRCYFRKFPVLMKMAVVNRDGYMIDSLYNEYLVGKVINEFADVFPFFAKTYAFGELKDYALYGDIMNVCDVAKEVKTPIGKLFSKYDDGRTQIRSSIFKYDAYKDTCFKHAMPVVYPFALFSQFIDAEYNYKNYYTKNAKKASTILQILSLNALIVSLLYGLQGHFTHYDLHSENVLLRQVPDNKYIRFKIHGPAGPKSEPLFEVYSCYFPVIIDYGRCYVRGRKAKAPSFEQVRKSIGKNQLNTCGYNIYMGTYTDNLDTGSGALNLLVNHKYDMKSCVFRKDDKVIKDTWTRLNDLYARNKDSVFFKHAPTTAGSVMAEIEDNRKYYGGNRLSVNDAFGFYETEFQSKEIQAVTQKHIIANRECLCTVDLYTEGLHSYDVHME